MDAKEAIAKAKDWIADIYADEAIRNVGLEEIKLDEDRGDWLVTIGFSRPWDTHRGAVSVLADLTSRSYKVVRIDYKSGDVVSVENRVFDTP